MSGLDDELDQIYRVAPVGICLVDRELRFRRINERLAAINGTAVDDHIGRRVRDVLPGFGEDIERRYAKVLETGEPTELEMQAAPPSDPGVEHRWLVRDHPFLGPGGRVEGIVTVVQDITERSLAEAALRRARGRLADSHEVVGLASWEWDFAADELWWSDGMAALLGWASLPDEPSFDDFVERVHSDDRPRLRSQLDAAIASGEPEDVEFRILRGGVTRTVRSIVRFDSGSEALPRRLIGAALDVTPYAERTAGDQAEIERLRAALARSRAENDALRRRLGLAPDRPEG